jgi:hypothetical protein
MTTTMTAAATWKVAMIAGLLCSGIGCGGAPARTTGATVHSLSLSYGGSWHPDRARACEDICGAVGGARWDGQLAEQNQRGAWLCGCTPPTLKAER